MIIGIEAQRLFRKEKHGMDYVVLNELRQLQVIDSENEYYVFVKPGEDHCLSDSNNMLISFGNNGHCHELLSIIM